MDVIICEVLVFRTDFKCPASLLDMGLIKVSYLKVVAGQCINVNRLFRTKALVLELLAAVCLVRGGHDIILAAFDNFKEVSRVIAVADSHHMYF